MLLYQIWITLLMVNTVHTARKNKCPKDKSQGVSSRTDVILSLLKDYDARIPPNFELKEDEATQVGVQINVYSVDSFSETTMDFSISLFLQQQWSDPRLNWQKYPPFKEPLELDAKFMNNIWVPDLFFSNEKKASFHLVSVPNRMMHLHRNGSILYSVRVSLTLACQMKLHYYPFDSQICRIVMESYGHTTETLRFVWFDDLPLEIQEGLELPTFDLLGTQLKDCTKVYGGTSNYTCLMVELALKRKVGFFVVQIYIPSILIVILSWVSFWLNVDAIPARISLGVLTILTMTTQSSATRTSLPRVSYVKAIDVWMFVCLVFVFAGLVEFALINVLSRRDARMSGKGGEEEEAECHCNKENRGNNIRPSSPSDKENLELLQIDGIREGDSLVSSRRNSPVWVREVKILPDTAIKEQKIIEENGAVKNRSKGKRKRQRGAKAAKRKQKASYVDQMSRIIFPTTFLLFNAVYWLHCMLQYAF